MRKIMETPSLTLLQKIRNILIRIAGLLIIIVPLFFAVSALGSRFGLWDWTFGFGTLTRNIGPKLLFLTLGVGILCIIFALLAKPRKGILVGVLAVVLPIAGMGYAKSVSAKAQSLPFIHDISTDTQNVPMFTQDILDARKKTAGINGLNYSEKMDPGSKTLASVAQVKAYSDIRPLIRQETPKVLFDKALKTANAMGWKVVTSDAATGRIEATDTTFWFGFKDDVVIRIQAGEGGGSVLDIRSVSRVGMSDIGKNAARIRGFVARL